MLTSCPSTATITTTTTSKLPSSELIRPVRLPITIAHSTIPPPSTRSGAAVDLRSPTAVVVHAPVNAVSHGQATAVLCTRYLAARLYLSLDTMEVTIPKLNKVISADHLREGALEVIRAIRPEWAKERLNYKIFTDGITNRLVGVYRDDKHDMILIRVYGENTDLFIDRALEFRNMRTMYKAGLSAPIYCTFANGISYGFTPGKVLDERMVRDGKISALIAENLARMHTLKPLVGSVKCASELAAADSPHPCLVAGLKKFLVLIDSAFPRTANSCTRPKCFCSPKNLQAEADFLESELQKLKSPIVFCHNDLLLKNIIYNDSQNKVTFIDFEYSDYNYQAFDIANHFCEFCGVDNFEPSLYPNKEFQFRWLRVYLQKWHALNDNTPVPAELERKVETLYEAVSRFALASHLYWGLWAVVQASNSSIDFDYLGFAHKRLEEYFKRKHELFGPYTHHRGH